MDNILKYILLDVCGLLRLRPFVPGASGRHFPRPGVGNAYSFAGSPQTCLIGGPGLCPGLTREAGGVDRW
jgi:hypothetical protein